MKRLQKNFEREMERAQKEFGNHYKCSFIPIWLSLNPNAL